MSIRFRVDEIFNVPGRGGPIVAGCLEEGKIKAGAILVDPVSRSSVRVIALEFATPKSLDEGRLGLVLDPDQAGFVTKGMLLVGDMPR